MRMRRVGGVHRYAPPTTCKTLTTEELIGSLPCVTFSTWESVAKTVNFISTGIHKRRQAGSTRSLPE